MGSQDLQTGRYDQLIRRVGGLYGPGSKVIETLPEVFPVIELENTTPELLGLMGWRLAWQSAERPANVGSNPATQLFNPAGSGVIAAVTRLDVRVQAIAPAVQAEIQTTQFGTPVSGLFRDARFGTPRRTALQTSHDDGVAVGGGLRVFPTLETLSIRDDNGIAVLTPGSGLSVGSPNNNIQLTVTYWWRERIALDSELLFP